MKLRLLGCALTFLYFLGAARHSENRIVVGKNFTEQLIPGEIIAQQLEAKTKLEVERRASCWNICAHQAIVGGRVDIYPEYTGTSSPLC
jgi:glycine betaine/choline ABC-type transport system substrate-binding protein